MELEPALEVLLDLAGVIRELAGDELGHDQVYRAGLCGQQLQEFGGLRPCKARALAVDSVQEAAFVCTAWFNRPGRRVTLCPGSIGSNTIPVKTLRHARLGRSVTRG